jgi:uncharacterized RDD family membrane protein YckC
VPRALAYVIDIGIRVALFAALAALLSQFRSGGNGLLMIAAFLLEWFYPVAFEVWWGGATPGKRAFGLAVLGDNGTPVTFGASVTRNLLRAVDFLPMLYAFGLVSMLLSRDFKRLGDLAAGTIVVYRDRPGVRAPIPAAPPLPPAVALSLEERRAILDFAERYATLSEERADEVAAHATPLLRHGTPAARTLLGIANHQRGGKAA